LDNFWLVAGIWMGLALIASLISIRLGITVALMEIIFGVIGGNLFGLHATPWIDTLANFGVVFLTFLAGAEIEPQSLKKNLKPTLAIGLSSFLVPFAVISLFSYYAAGWELKASLVAGLALSTTSVAVIYTVLSESGLASSNLGRLILAACFVTDFSAVLTLGLISIELNIWLAILVAALILSIWLLPPVLNWTMQKYGGRLSRPDSKFIILVLLLLSWLATSAGSQAVLPAYIIGIVCAGILAKHRALINHLQIIMFTVLTPFYFLKAGSLVALPSVISGAGWILIFLALNMVTKFIGVFPLTAMFKIGARDGMYTTLLMSTGLTFGIISALYGLTNNVIDQGQYTVLITAVILSALVPTIVAQAWFKPQAQENTSPQQE
jgi:Kef-type K+ transport system membrane component KefB